jgi:hypothetical protein
VPGGDAFIAFGLTAVVSPGDESVKTEVGPALKAFQIGTWLLVMLVEHHWVGFYFSLNHSFESIPDAVPGFVFVKPIST